MNKLAKKVLEKEVNKKLENDGHITSGDMVNYLEEHYTLNEEELEEAIDIVYNSNYINYVVTSNGDAYLFGVSKNEVDHFIDYINDNVSNNDNVWSEFVKYGEYSNTLGSIWYIKSNGGRV